MERLSVKVLYEGINLEQNYRLQKNEKFQNFLASKADTSRKVKWAQPHGTDGWKRCARYDLKRPAPSRLQRFFDKAMPDFCYDEYTTYKDKAHGSWRITPHKPEFMSSMIKAHGNLTFKQQSNGVVRDVEGTVDVHLPFPLSALNGYVERHIVELTKKGLRDAAAATPQWIREQGIGD